MLTFNTGAMPYPDSIKLWFKALGSTIQSQSYAYVTIYVNEMLFATCHFLEPEWTWYYLSWEDLQNYLISGENTFRIYLPSDCTDPQTSPWIKNVEVEGFGYTSKDRSA